MKLFCCYTPAHEVLLRDYFLPSVPLAFVLTPIKLEIDGAGDFLSPEFLRCIAQKVELISKSIDENPRSVIVWSDIDIQFFELRPENLLSQLGKHDIAFQREGRNGMEVNTGFFVCHSSPQLSRFFLRVREALQRNPSVNEQYVINQLLRDPTPGVSWTYLPFAYYARTHGWPPPRDLVLYHANATAGDNAIGQKIRQFRELAFLRRFRIPALVITFIKYAPKRLFRLLSERLTRMRGGNGAGG